MSEFVSTFETYSSQIGFSYRLLAGDKVLVKQDAPFDFLDSVEKDDDIPNVQKTSDHTLQFSMGITINVDEKYHNRPLRLVFTLTYHMETFGLNSNQLQIEAERRSSTIDLDRNDHLRGYVGMDEEEFNVRQLMEFNRFRPTKVPPRETELSVEVVKPVSVTSRCEEIGPSCAILTVQISNAYPGTAIALHGVTVHTKETIKGATLLLLSGQEGKDGSSSSGGGDSPDTGPGVSNIQEDLLLQGGDTLEVVDLDDNDNDNPSPNPNLNDNEGRSGSVVSSSLGSVSDVCLESPRGGDQQGGTSSTSSSGKGDGNGNGSAATFATRRSSDDSTTIQQDQAPASLSSSSSSSSSSLSSSSSSLDADNAYHMQTLGQALDVSGLFSFTALDPFPPATRSGSESVGDGTAPLVVPALGSTELRYRVEPRYAGSSNGPHRPFLYSSLLVGDFFSPVSLVWSHGGAGNSGVINSSNSNSSSSSRWGEGGKIEKHVAYWSMGKRWANMCCFTTANNNNNNNNNTSVAAVVSVHNTPYKDGSSGGGSTGAVSINTPRGVLTEARRGVTSTTALGTQIGEGTPTRRPIVVSAMAGNHSTGSGSGSGSSLEEETSLVITPSKAVLLPSCSSSSSSSSLLSPPPTSSSTGGYHTALSSLSGGEGGEEGAFVLSMRGPAWVALEKPFEVEVEIRNRSAFTYTELSLLVGNTDGEEGDADDGNGNGNGATSRLKHVPPPPPPPSPFVVHESCTAFAELLPPGHSFRLTLHVYPLAAGPLNLSSVRLVDNSSSSSSSSDGGRVYEFLQFYSCFVGE
jgi:hypothetical protein